MTTEAIAPLPKLRFVDNNGNALVGGLLFTYAAGSVTKQTTFTDSTGGTPNTNPIVLDARGECNCWLDPSLPYKFTLSPANDTDPPTNPIWTEDNVYGVQVVAGLSSEWVASGMVPTYVDANNFSVPGNQTGLFTVGRRVRATVTLGTIYGTIIASAFSAHTTVTVSWDTGQLDSGLSLVSYGLLSALNPSIPLGEFLQAQTYQAFTTAGTPPSYTLTPIPAIVAYTAGLRFNVKFANASAGSDTLQINGVATPPHLVYLSPTGAYGNIPAGGIVAGLVADVILLSATQALVVGTFPSISPDINDFRLTLTSGVPVTIGDVTGATTIYCTPYKGPNIALYNGTAWELYKSSEFSLALGTLTASLLYDVFSYDNAEVPTLEFLAWASATARATALAYQDGVLVKSGAPTRRYMGTFYTSSTTQTADAAATRYLENYYNQVDRQLRGTFSVNRDPGAATVYAEINAEIQIKFVAGVVDNPMRFSVVGTALPGGATVVTGVGIDSTSAATAGLEGGNNGGLDVNIGINGAVYPAIGYHYATLLGMVASIGATYYAATANTGAVKVYLSAVKKG